MSGTLTARVERFDYMDYEYKDLVIKGNIRDQLIALDATMDDKNLNFALNAGYNFRDDVPLYTRSSRLEEREFRSVEFEQEPHTRPWYPDGKYGHFGS